MQNRLKILLLIISLMMALTAFTQNGTFFYQTTVKRTCEVYGPQMTLVRNCDDEETKMLFEVTPEIDYVKIHDVNKDLYTFEIFDTHVYEEEEGQIYFKTRDITDNRLYQFLFNVKAHTITMFADDYPTMAVLYFYSDSWKE